MSTDSVKMDTGIPLFFPEIQYLLLETIPLEIIMRVSDNERLDFNGVLVVTFGCINVAV